jgi:hypothetical protein
MVVDALCWHSGGLGQEDQELKPSLVYMVRPTSTPPHPQKKKRKRKKLNLWKHSIGEKKVSFVYIFRFVGSWLRFT